MRYIVNAFGKMKLVTFKEFLKEVPIKTLEDSSYPYYTFYARFRPRRYFEVFGDFLTIDAGEYKPYILHLKMGHIETVLKECLLQQSEQSLMSYIAPLSDTFWYLCGENTKIGGSPTHLIRVSRRVWLVANSKEFLIVKNNNGIGLICNQPM